MNDTLDGQTVVVLGGSSGIGFAVAEAATRSKAKVIITGRDMDRLETARTALGAYSENFDVYDAAALDRFFEGLDTPVDHLFVAAGGPSYALLGEIVPQDAGQSASQGLKLMLQLGQYAAKSLRPAGTLTFMGGTSARRPALGMTLIGASMGMSTALVQNLALEISPARVNMIAAGFVDTPLSARLLGPGLNERRAELAKSLPIRRVVQATDVASLALHIMSNGAITGAVLDIDGGQQLIQSGS